MNAFHANAPAKIESKRGKSCGARDERRAGRWDGEARRCEDNWVNTFGPAVCRRRRYIPRSGPRCSLALCTRVYVRTRHTREKTTTQPRTCSRFEGNELRIGDTTGSQDIVRDLKKRTAGRRDSCRGPSSEYVAHRSRLLSRLGDCSLANERSIVQRFMGPILVYLRSSDVPYIERFLYTQIK